MVKIIDLFSGCGGLSLGFIENGFDVFKAVEFNEEIADTYKKNHPEIDVIVDDIKNVDHSNIFSAGCADVIIGGPPCQGFSMAGARIREGFIGDPRNYLFKHYFNIVKAVKPKVFIIENVKGIMTMEGGKIFREILNIFSNKKLLGGFSYNMNFRVVKCVDFGIPQKRERMIIVGTIDKIDFDSVWENTRNDVLNRYPTFFDKVTVYDAISNLPDTTKTGKIKTPIPLTNYQKFLATNNDFIYNHISTNHSKKAIDRMKQIKCGENFTSLNEKINSVHSGAYGRLEWNQPSQTITTRFDTPAGGRFIHPNKNRTLSPREAARLQSFPDSFVFYGTKTSICKQIGNAVPPKISLFLSFFVNNILNK